MRDGPGLIPAIGVVLVALLFVSLDDAAAGQYESPSGKYSIELLSQWQEIPADELAAAMRQVDSPVDYTAGFHRAGHGYFDLPYILTLEKDVPGMGTGVQTQWDYLVKSLRGQMPGAIREDRVHNRIISEGVTPGSDGSSVRVVSVVTFGRQIMMFFYGYCSIETQNCFEQIDEVVSGIVFASGERVADAQLPGTGQGFLGALLDPAALGDAAKKGLVGGIVGGIVGLIGFAVSWIRKRKGHAWSY